MRFPSDAWGRCSFVGRQEPLQDRDRAQHVADRLRYAITQHDVRRDKPMRDHGLMQAIARVNRVFRDKPGGLVVDYLGLADQLKQALATYADSGGRGTPSFDTAAPIAVMLEKHEIACGL
jgi:hypothetical protein